MFSKMEELNYLTDLLLSASQWQCSENEPLSPLHLEVKDRIRRLTEQETINVVGVPSDQIHGQEQHEQDARECKSKPKKKFDDAEYKRRWTEGMKETHVRTTVNGKTKWVKKEHVEKGPKSKGNGWRWCIKPEFVDLYK